MTEVQTPTAAHGTDGWRPSRYGPDDEAGALNEITPAKVLEAGHHRAGRREHRTSATASATATPTHAVVLRYGTGGSSELFADLTEASAGRGLGGITVDKRSNVYLCSPAGVTILSPDGGRLGAMQLPEPATNLTWGDDDCRTLYLTTTTSIYRTRLRS